VTKLLAALEVTPEFRARKKHLDAQVHLVGKLPGDEFSEVLGGGHAADSCNRMARMCFTNSRLIVRDGTAAIAKSSIFCEPRPGCFCDVTF
jgi:hypothetical protein